ncbi:MAG: hypothetical protein SWK76_17155 [Actinomycetota bacterium]|nr:hypothetical protein [Actinomycetota bacterium]
MVIKGISDILRFTRAGKIKLGVKKISRKSGNPYPDKADHFIWPEKHKEILTDTFGDDCRELDIKFPVDDPEVIASQYYRRYGKNPEREGAGRLICKGDGENATYIDPETGEIMKIKCLGPECEAYRQEKCKMTMYLLFIIPQLVELGVWQLDTSSFNSIVNVNSGMEYIRRITGGRLAMVPLKLRLVPKEVFPLEVGRTTVYVLELNLAPGALGQLEEGKAPAALPPAAMPEAAEVEKEASEDLYPDSVIDDKLDEEIASLFKKLDYTQGQCVLRTRQWGADKQGLAAHLKEELAGRGRKTEISTRRGADSDGTRTPPENPVTGNPYPDDSPAASHISDDMAEGQESLY